MSKQIKYFIAIACLVLFISCDLIFDYALDFSSSNIISFGFTLISAIIVFVFTGQLKKEQQSGYYKASMFIQSNFDKYQVIFSVLDIICGLISILVGLSFLISIKVIKLLWIPTKIICVINKEKSIFKGLKTALSKGSLMWVFTRVTRKKGDNMAEETQEVTTVETDTTAKTKVKTKKKSQWFKKLCTGIKNALKYVFVSNPKASTTTLLNACLSGVTGYTLTSTDISFMPTLMIGNFDMMTVIIAAILFIAVEFLGIRYAFESNDAADARKLVEQSHFIPEAEANEKLMSKVEELIVEAEKFYDKLDTVLKTTENTSAGQYKKESVLVKLQDYAQSIDAKFNKEYWSEIIDKKVSFARNVN